MYTSQDLGKSGENIAVEFLKKQGYKILQTNFRSKFGEIDIVALDGNILSFIEVKARWSQDYGSPKEAITPWKIRRMTKTAYYFKLLHPKLPDSLRLDAVVIEMENGEIESVELIKNLTT